MLCRHFSNSRLSLEGGRGVPLQLLSGWDKFLVDMVEAEEVGMVGGRSYMFYWPAAGHVLVKLIISGYWSDCAYKTRSGVARSVKPASLRLIQLPD